MARSVPNSLLIPVETLNRELDGKLLLALLAASRGMQVFLGGRQAIHARLPNLPTSIYLAKGIRTGNRVIFGIAERSRISVRIGWRPGGGCRSVLIARSP